MRGEKNERRNIGSNKKRVSRKEAKKANLKKISERLIELKNNEFVKEYLAIVEQLKNIDVEKKIQASDTDIIESSFPKYLSKIEETNKIYVYLGTYTTNLECDIIHGSTDSRVKRDDPSASYSLYQDIENNNVIQIPINKYQKFEQQNTVIIPKRYLTESYYYELQKEFFKDCVILGQEEAVKKILKRKSN